MNVKIIYTAHVLTQMFKRDISREDIKYVIRNGVIIKEYPEDKPYSSFLILGHRGKRPLHVVYSVNELGYKIIITAYQPDSSIWNQSFNIKKK